MSTKTVTPVVNQTQTETSKDKLTQVPVTITENEIATILYKTTESVLNLAFDLQDDYDNPSLFQKDALQDAAVMFLKAQCQRAIGKWDSIVNQATKLQKYSTMNRSQVEDALKIHPKCVTFYKAMQKAVEIKKTLK